MIGVEATAAVVFQQSSFMCIEVDIISIDIRTVIEKATKGDTALNSFNKLAKILEWSRFEQWVQSLLTNTIYKKLMVSLPQTIINKLQLKLAADIELITCTDAEQGPFLVSTMQELNLGKSSRED